MKIRAKNKAEKFYDDNTAAQAKTALADHAIVYFNEHQEFGDDTMHRTFTDACDLVCQYERAKDIVAMPKVGDHWDYDKGIVGSFRYRNT